MVIVGGFFNALFVQKLTKSLNEADSGSILDPFERIRLKIYAS